MLRAFLTTLAILGFATTPAVSLEFDRLRMLTAEEHVPWRAVGRVNIANFGERGMCTGTLISEDLVLTAAHCVISDRTGAPHAPGNIHFVAGWRQGQRVGHSVASEIIIHSEYLSAAEDELRQIGADLAVIRLEDPIPAKTAPFFSVAPSPGGDAQLTLISYRRDRAHALTRQEGCKILGEEGSVMALGCDVTFGASGSPIFADVDGERRLIGVISAMSRPKGRPVAWAVRLDAAIGDVLYRLP